MSDKQHNCPDCTHVEACSEVGEYLGMTYRCTLPAKHIANHTVLIGGSRSLTWCRVQDGTSYTLYWRAPDSVAPAGCTCPGYTWSGVTWHWKSCPGCCGNELTVLAQTRTCRRSKGHRGPHQKEDIHW